ncbi:MAG: UDP-N-acetylglucosamine 1-carboxyvinyltransferase, partial [Campylobacter hyointestinalis]
LVNLGANAKFDDSNLVINTSTINSTKATYDIVRKMRASILVLGPLLTRFGLCEVSLPGGCAIGARPIDLHLSALEKMGANIEIKDGYVVAKATGGLKGANIVFDKITVTGTENIVMAAALAKGKTTILNAAKEPEVVQVCQILNDSGIKIEGIGTSELIIHGNGGELLNLAKICVIPDRIEAGTYLCACAISGGEITLNGVEPSHLVSVLDKLSDMGVRFELEKNSIKVISDAKLAPVNIITTEFPGFPTDMQAQFMALAAVADGVSTIDERLFENRFMHASELSRMGADIKLNGHIATISGSSLNGADVMATDLRASSALVLAALRANGITRVHRIYHLDRGYENLEKKLQNLGADIKRLSE